jgi:hypothetical protein
VGIVLLPIMLGIFLIGFIPTLVLVSRVKSSFPWYFQSKAQSIIHWALVLAATYFGYSYGWEIVNSNFPSANDGFGSDRSGFLFMTGLLLPGICCLVLSVISVGLGRIYFKSYTK